MTHRELADLGRPLFWGAVAVSGVIVGTACGLAAWRLTGPRA